VWRRGSGRPYGGDDLDDPLVSLLITVADLMAMAGGALASIFAIGYASVGRSFGVWGTDAGIAIALVAADVGLRGWRRNRRRREWRRYHPDEAPSR
jgi:hypothetical protein